MCVNISEYCLNYMFEQVDGKQVHMFQLPLLPQASNADI